MGQIPPRDQLLFYIHNEGEDPQFFFEKKDDGLEPIDVTSQEASSIASVIGIKNYQSFLDTLNQSKEKIIDDQGNTMYLVKIDDASNISKIKSSQLVTLRNVEQLAKAVKEKQFSRLARQFSSDFFQKAHLLVTQNAGVTPLEQISKKHSPKPFSEISCSSDSAGAIANDCVDLDHNTVKIGDIVYKITYSLNDKQQDLSKVPPAQKEAFLMTIRESIIEANKLSNDGDAKKVVLSFNSKCELTEVKSYSKDLFTPSLRLNSSDRLIINLKNDLRDVLLSLNGSISRLHKTPLAVNGVPRGSQHQSCWFGSGLQIAAHLYGDKLENYRNYLISISEEVPDHIERFVHMKRKILGQERGPISDSEVTALHEALVAYGILDRNTFTLIRQNAPEDFIGALSNHEPFDQLKNYVIAGDTPRVLKELIKAKTNQDHLEAFDAETEIHVFIERNVTTQKTANQITLEKMLTLENTSGINCDFELVGAVEHIGEVAASGHYISYSFQNGKWHCCNDAQVSEVMDEQKLLEHLSLHSTELVYRKLPQKPDATIEEEIAPLHSLSAVDTDNWVKAKVVIDFAKKQTEGLDIAVITIDDNSQLFKVGPGINLMDLQSRIEQVPNHHRAFIPLIKVHGPSDHISKHFVALVVDKSQEPTVFEYFDSTGRDAPQDLIDFISTQSAIFKPVLDENSKWQHDGFRCGYYVSRFFELKAEGKSADEITAKIDERFPNTHAVDDLRLRMRLIYNRYQDNFGFSRQ